MGKKQRQTVFSSNPTEDRALAELANFKLRDLKTACILRGLNFENVIEYSVPKLSTWFIQHYDNGQDTKLLTEFDSYVEGKLKERGYKNGDALLAPALKYGVVVDVESIDKPREIKPHKIIKEKVKAVKDEKTGVRAGTKKALTFQLAMEGLPIEEVTKQVMKEFPAAEPKSIKIWYKRCMKEKSNK